MPAVQRKGDPNSSGGIATGGVATVRVNGRPVAVPGISVTPHPCCGQPGCGAHCAATTSGGSGSVRAGGKPVLRTSSDSDTCGHPRSGGSSNVRTP
jgi:uncharacterized Zn-binding protein involved in type VI secretion